MLSGSGRKGLISIPISVLFQRLLCFLDVLKGRMVILLIDLNVLKVVVIYRLVIELESEEILLERNASTEQISNRISQDHPAVQFLSFLSEFVLNMEAILNG